MPNYSWTWVDGSVYDIDAAYDGCDPTSNCQWAVGEPNDLTGTEDCLQMGASTLLAPIPASWNDADCNSKRQFVCKRAVPAADAGPVCGTPPTTTTITSTTTTTTSTTTTTTTSTTTTTTTVPCPEQIPNLPEGATSPTCSDLSDGATCTAVCSTGTLVGQSTYTCTAGVWVNPCSYQCTTNTFFGDNTYYYSGGNVGVTFPEAVAACDDLGMTLVSVASRAENDFVFNLQPDTSKLRWIGYTRDRSVASGLVFTAVDGVTSYDALLAMYDGCTPGVDCLWQLDEPNDLKGEETCVQMGLGFAPTNDGAWNDAACDSLRAYVCRAVAADFYDTSCSTTTAGPTTTASTVVPSGAVTTAAVTTTAAATTTTAASGSEASCSSSIPGLPANAIASCTDRTHGATCNATCGSGLYATGTPTYTCQDGVWVGGCQFICSSWQTFGSSIYYYSKDYARDQLSFDDASAACSALGASLASVASRAENEFIFNFNPVIKSDRWLGGRRSASGSFEWTDGTPFDIAADFAGCTPGVDCLWTMGEPNNLNNVEDCIQMGLKGATTPGGWNDAQCTFLRDYVCKAPLPNVGDCPATTTAAPTTTVSTVATTTAATTTTTTVAATTTTTAAATTTAATTTTTTTAGASTTTVASGAVSFALLYVSDGSTGTRPNTLFDSSKSENVLITSKSQTTEAAFTNDCQALAQASIYRGVFVQITSIHFLCYRLTDLGSPVSTSVVSRTYVKL